MVNVNKKTRRITWWRWLPSMAVAMLIYYLSNQSDPIGKLSSFTRWMGLDAGMHLIPDKIAHFAEYFLLTVSFWCARSDDNRDSLTAGYAKVFLLVAVFALTDEFHQGLVPHRTPDIRDYSADTLGSLMALAWIHLYNLLSGFFTVSRQT